MYPYEGTNENLLTINDPNGIDVGAPIQTDAVTLTNGTKTFTDAAATAALIGTQVEVDYTTAADVPAPASQSTRRLRVLVIDDEALLAKAVGKPPAVIHDLAVLENWRVGEAMAESVGK